MRTNRNPSNHHFLERNSFSQANEDSGRDDDGRSDVLPKERIPLDGVRNDEWRHSLVESFSDRFTLVSLLGRIDHELAVGPTRWLQL